MVAAERLLAELVAAGAFAVAGSWDFVVAVEASSRVLLSEPVGRALDDRAAASFPFEVVAEHLAASSFVEDRQAAGSFQAAHSALT